MEFTTREGSKAVYGGNLYRIENVIFVTSLQDSVSKRRDGRQNEKKQSQGFASVFEQACADLENHDISYTASGYTKTGMGYHYLEKRREYAYSH